jgi:hypothetical protein
VISAASSKNAWVRAALLAAAWLGLGCESPETKACLGSYASAQELVKGIDAKSRESVEKSLAAVEAALSSCRTAKRHGEVDQLLPVKNQLTAQVGALERRAARSARKKPTPDELRRLEKDGDPNCPKGQAYRPEGAKEIRCTGPQLAEMSSAEAGRYFDELGFRVTRPSPTKLEAERGAERTTFVYPSAAPGARPSCILLVPAPDIPWLEALTRTTGANPARVKTTSGKVKVAQGELAYAVDEKNNSIRIGDCP